VHIGHSTGGGEVACYVAQHGAGRGAKAVLVSAVPPLMLKTDANPGGLPIEFLERAFRNPDPLRSIPARCASSEVPQRR
jgi:pimeloyl-ACP methyl ester carboxylesterase